MEHRKLSLLDSCIFTENDGVDSAPAIALPGVRYALFGVVLFQRGGEGVRTEELGRPPRFKRLFWDLGLCYLEECEYVRKRREKKEGHFRLFTFNGFYFFLF